VSDRRAQPPTLSTRALNRALLARQRLLERAGGTIEATLERVAGLQAQYAPAGYIGLWSRLAGFERPMLTAALEEHRVVQATMMRATIHLVSAADYWPMTAGVRRIRREWFAAVGRRDIGSLDMEAAAASVRELLATGPLPFRELTARMEARGFPSVATRWAGMWVDLVRAPPSGTWERRRADLYGLAETWLTPADVVEGGGIAHLVRRYLGAFGPAAPRDVADWMGATVGHLRAALEGMRLRSFRDADGRALLDLTDAPLPDPDLPAPVRFLPVWDATLLAHARRTQVLPEELRPRIFNTKTPHSVNTFLVDGQVAGTWRHERGRIELDPLRRLTAAERRAVDDEAHRLEAFHAG
jgi:hypothetical protein